MLMDPKAKQQMMVCMILYTKAAGANKFRTAPKSMYVCKICLSVTLWIVMIASIFFVILFWALYERHQTRRHRVLKDLNSDYINEDLQNLTFTAIRIKCNWSNSNYRYGTVEKISKRNYSHNCGCRPQFEWKDCCEHNDTIFTNFLLYSSYSWYEGFA